jgi:hypothetical protein
MRHPVLAVVLAGGVGVGVGVGCSFGGLPSQGDDSADDGGDDGPVVIDADPADPDARADAEVDARVDAEPVVTCGVVPVGPQQNAEAVGGNGGSAGPVLECDGGEVVIGVGVHMSDQTTKNGGRSARGFAIACATITLSSIAAPVVGAETTHEVLGNGTSDWAPSTFSGFTYCEPGWAVSGLAAHRGEADVLFRDVSITCAQLGLDGMPTGVTQSIYVEGSLDDDENNDTSACAEGRVVNRVNTRRGAGFDQATPVCVATGCG